MDLGIQGKVALVTGASKTIGYSIARRLGLEGARVAICARGKARLEAAARQLEAEGITVWFRVADVTDPEQVRGLIAGVIETYGQLSILVNTPGGWIKPGPFSAIAPEDWIQGMKVNMLSVISVLTSTVAHRRARIPGPTCRD